MRYSVFSAKSFVWLSVFSHGFSNVQEIAFYSKTRIYMVEVNKAKLQWNFVKNPHHWVWRNLVLSTWNREEN